MKLGPSTQSKVERRASSVGIGRHLSPVTRHPSGGFTMIEIALCLAIIGIALVAIIGVLPMGMNVQKDNREETVINQDATMLMDAIRNGSHGLDDLTNYVYAITNYWVLFNGGGTVSASGQNGYTYRSSTVAWTFSTGLPITNGAYIIGLLSTPEFTDKNGNPINNGIGISSYAGSVATPVSYYSNHIVAYVRSMSGSAVDKPPQDNPLMQQDAFTYRLVAVNSPLAPDTNDIALTNIFNQQLAANLHELRLHFNYPLQPSGSVGGGDHTFRSLVGGQIVITNVFGQVFYYYQSQSFVNTP